MRGEGKIKRTVTRTEVELSFQKCRARLNSSPVTRLMFLGDFPAGQVIISPKCGGAELCNSIQNLRHNSAQTFALLSRLSLHFPCASGARCWRFKSVFANRQNVARASPSSISAIRAIISRLRTPEIARCYSQTLRRFAVKTAIALSRFAGRAARCRRRIKTSRTLLSTPRTAFAPTDPNKRLTYMRGGQSRGGKPKRSPLRSANPEKRNEKTRQERNTRVGRRSSRHPKRITERAANSPRNSQPRTRRTRRSTYANQ